MSFDDCTTVTKLSSHTYAVHLHENWTIGSVPHGGYVTSCIQRAVRKHFETTLAAQKQPDCMTLHLSFLRRTQVGEARIVVKDVKLGRQTSTVHVSLDQDGREEVVGYIIHTSLASEKGHTFETNWRLSQPPPPADHTALAADVDRHWHKHTDTRFQGFRKAHDRIDLYFPRGGPSTPRIVDQWMRLSNGEENWTNDSLGFVVDAFPQIVETFIAVDDSKSTLSNQEPEKGRRRANFWYPTLLLNLEVKKLLPEGGTPWLFLRLESKTMKNGRYDLEILVLDMQGELVAVSNHVVMIVSAERNLAARSNSNNNNKTKL